MLYRTKAICLNSCAVLAWMALPGFAFASPAPAPAAADSVAVDDSSAGTLSEIIVTAQKRSENLQSTPIAISVLKGEDLANRHVQSLLDLGDGAVPSLKVAPFFSRPGALIVNIRGVGVLSDSNQPARDQGVGIYIDGVYQGRAQGLGSALYDIENIEVLKGPQGTLFGRNTEGGAVNIVTKRPTGQFKLNATVGYGNYNSHKGEVHLDLPEFANISIKLDGILTTRDAFVKNPFPGAEGYNSFDKRGLHAKALWKPISDFAADLSFDKSYDATSTLNSQFISAGVGLPATATNPASTNGALAAYTRFAAAGIPNVVAALNPLQPNRVDTVLVGLPQQPGVGNAIGYRLGLEYKVASNLTLKSITAYREMTQTQFDNGSGVPSLQIPVSAGNPNGLFNLATPTVSNFVNSINAGAVPAFNSGVPGTACGRYSLVQFRQNQVSEGIQIIGEFNRLKYQIGACTIREPLILWNFSRHEYG